MLLCSYENRMGITLDPKKVEDGEIKLQDLLTDEDFTMAHSVCIFYHMNTDLSGPLP